MRRLAIFDPANGHQPMVTPDGRLTLIFNGAIYNYRALRAELAGGWDSAPMRHEVLLAASPGGAKPAEAAARHVCLRRVGRGRGPALPRAAIRSASSRSITGTTGGGCFRLGNSKRAHRLGGPAEIDPAAVATTSAGSRCPPRGRSTSNVHPSAGESATFCRGELAIRPTGAPLDSHRHSRAKSRLNSRPDCARQLEDSDSGHVLADVPVGLPLRRTRLARRRRAHDPGAGRPCDLFDRLHESAYSEAEAAAASARHFGSDHHPVWSPRGRSPGT